MRKKLRTQKKLDKLFLDRGCTKGWLARRIGISEPLLWAVCCGTIIPTYKYWSKFIEQTFGYVTMEDLVSDYITIKMSKIGGLEVKEKSNGKSWTITLKTPTEDLK